MDTLLWAICSVISLLLSVVWWIAGYLFWVFIWLILPFAIVAYLAMRAAEAIVGRDAVRAWVKDRSRRLGGGIWDRLSRLLLASSVLPFRVLFWFVVYAIWHSIVSLMWTPKWRPWTRAWSKRWRPPATAAPKSVRNVARPA